MSEDDTRVLVDFSVFEQIHSASWPHANFTTPRAEWVEVYGFLFGKLKDNLLYLKKAELIKVGEKIAVEFDEQDYLKAAQVEAQYYEEGLFHCGWWHTHPDMGCFLSGTDKENQLLQSANHHYIALVYDFTRLTPDHPGFEIFKLANPGIGVDSEFIKVKWKFHKAKSKTLHRLSALLDPYVPVPEREKARETDILKKKEHRVDFFAQKDAKGEIQVKQAFNLAQEGNYEAAIQYIANALPGLEKSENQTLFLDALAQLGEIYLLAKDYAQAVQAGMRLREASPDSEDSFYYEGLADLIVGQAIWHLGDQYAKRAFNHLKNATEQLGLANYHAGAGRAFWELGTMLAQPQWKKNFDACKFLGHAKKSYERALSFSSSIRRLGESEESYKEANADIEATIRRLYKDLTTDERVRIRQLYTELGLINKPTVSDLYGVHF